MHGALTGRADHGGGGAPGANSGREGRGDLQRVPSLFVSAEATAGNSGSTEILRTVLVSIERG
jgi:hypothetical protein